MKSRLFDTIKIRPPKKNTFDLSHEKKLTLNFAELVPVYLQEIIPGDFFRVSSESMLRFSPLISPAMHRINSYIHYFFVPNRLVWDNWKDFITGGVDGKSAPEFPYLLMAEDRKTKFVEGSLADYFGIPTVDQVPVMQYSTKINSLPFRAYQLIYNEYYRDQTLCAEVAIDKARNGLDYDAYNTIRKRAWEKDYFTSALPFTQRGDDVLLPNTINYRNPALIVDENGDPVPPVGSLGLESTAGNFGGDGGGNPAIMDNIESLEITINDLRTSARLQEYLEKMARAGSRYVEQILAIFGVMSDDLQQSRPKYLGGGKTPVQISEVLATMGDENTVQGNMAGHGISVGYTNTFKQYFKEHGYVIGIMSVLPSTCYSQGIDRTFIKESRFDFFTPDFANLGEQPVYNRELYYDPQLDDNNEVFGYQSRYSEYKYNTSKFLGNFRSTLDYWHLGRIFSGRPSLNESFVMANPDERIFAVTEGEHKIYAQIYNRVSAIRPIPIYGTPRL